MVKLEKNYIKRVKKSEDVMQLIGPGVQYNLLKDKIDPEFYDSFTDGDVVVVKKSNMPIVLAIFHDEKLIYSK